MDAVTVMTRAEVVELAVKACGDKAHVFMRKGGAARIVLHVGSVSRKDKLQLVDRKNALCVALRAHGLTPKKADGMRYTGSEFSSMNTGIRYEMDAV